MEGVILMEEKKTEPNEMTQILDRGIDDMEANRELPIEDAFNFIAELVEKRNLKEHIV